MVIPYYNQPKMLLNQLTTWASYPAEVRDMLEIIVVDDGSATRARGVFDTFIILHWLDRSLASAQYSPYTIQMYRILQDIPWNRGGARNLGSHVAITKWLLHMDIDHVLFPSAALALVRWLPEARESEWYRFKRFRVGPADETRMKDALPRDAIHGEIKPHIDSYLCTKALYDRVGGYDEDYSGCLGGGSPFLQQLGLITRASIAPDDISLNVLTRHSCVDASVTSLSRDTSEYSRRRMHKERHDNTEAKNPLRFEWKREL